MITAKEALAATNDRLVVMAKEFIINNVGMPIREAINNGRFHTTVSFEGVPSPEKTGAEVVRQLKEQGFEAEHVYYDNVNGYDNYIVIKWGDD
jgi:sorbitol-specific phosphotransferase system component IIA